MSVKKIIKKKLKRYMCYIYIYVIKTRLAQSVERRTFNPVVVGSSPTSSEMH